MAAEWCSFCLTKHLRPCYKLTKRLFILDLKGGANAVTHNIRKERNDIRATHTQNATTLCYHNTKQPAQPQHTTLTQSQTNRHLNSFKPYMRQWPPAQWGPASNVTPQTFKPRKHHRHEHLHSSNYPHKSISQRICESPSQCL